MAKSSKALQSLAVRYNEMNVLRSGLISLAQYIPKETFNWSMEQEPGVMLECRGDPDYGVPHGQDGDFFHAIIHLFTEAGAPEEGVVETTAYEILKLIGKGFGKQNYEALGRSLKRLYLSKYFLTRVWVDYSSNKRTVYESVSFTHLTRYDRTSDDQSTLSNGSILRLGIAPEIVKSVRAGYLVPANEQILKQLKHPTARGLFRLLEARRRDPMDPTRLTNEFTVPILMWAKIAKLLQDRLDNVRRALDSAHAELIEHGYLQEVVYEGRGKNQRLTYRFKPQFERIPNPELVALLEKYGVWPSAAREKVLKYEDRVLPVVQRFDVLKNTDYPITNAPGLIIRMLEDPDAFGVFTRPAIVQATAQTQLLPPEPETQPEPSDEEKIATLRFYVQTMFNKVMQKHEQHVFFKALEDGTLPVAKVHQKVTQKWLTSQSASECAELIQDLLLEHCMPQLVAESSQE